MMMTTMIIRMTNHSGSLRSRVKKQIIIIIMRRLIRMHISYRCVVTKGSFAIFTRNLKVLVD